MKNMSKMREERDAIENLMLNISSMNIFLNDTLSTFATSINA